MGTPVGELEAAQDKTSRPGPVRPPRRRPGTQRSGRGPVTLSPFPDDAPIHAAARPVRSCRRRFRARGGARRTARRRGRDRARGGVRPLLRRLRRGLRAARREGGPRGLPRMPGAQWRGHDRRALRRMGSGGLARRRRRGRRQLLLSRARGPRRRGAGDEPQLRVRGAGPPRPRPPARHGRGRPPAGADVVRRRRRAAAVPVHRTQRSAADGRRGLCARQRGRRHRPVRPRGGVGAGWARACSTSTMCSRRCRPASPPTRADAGRGRSAASGARRLRARHAPGTLLRGVGAPGRRPARRSGHRRPAARAPRCMAGERSGCSIPCRGWMRCGHLPRGGRGPSLRARLAAPGAGTGTLPGNPAHDPAATGRTTCSRAPRPARRGRSCT